MIEAIELVWTGPDLLVVVWPRAARNILALLFPGLTAVFRFEDTAGALFELDGCIQHIGIDR